MHNPLNTYVALDDAVDRQLVETLLTSSARLNVLEYADVDGPEVGTERGDALVVACAHYSAEVADYIARASRKRTNRPVVLLAPANGNGYVADAFGHGADDVVTLPDPGDASAATAVAPQVVFALEKAVARRRGAAAAPGQSTGELICVLGLKGGSGKTLTCANLAVALADAGKRVAVVDLDLQFGDLGLALGLAPDRTMYDLVRAGGTLDQDKLADFMPTHPSGAKALLAPTRPDQAGIVTPDFLAEVYPVLREMSDYVIVDTPPVFTPEVIAAVDGSSSVCMVAMLDSLSLKNTKLGLETLDLMDYDRDKIQLVLNRADSKVGISTEDVVSIMGRAPSIMVPSDRSVTRSINEGQPIAIANRRTDAARAFHALAHLYLGERPQEDPPGRVRRRRLFTRR